MLNENKTKHNKQLPLHSSADCSPVSLNFSFCFFSVLEKMSGKAYEEYVINTVLNESLE